MVCVIVRRVDGWGSWVPPSRGAKEGSSPGTFYIHSPMPFPALSHVPFHIYYHLPLVLPAAAAGPAPCRKAETGVEDDKTTRVPKARRKTRVMEGCVVL